MKRSLGWLERLRRLIEGEEEPILGDALHDAASASAEMAKKMAEMSEAVKQVGGYVRGMPIYDGGVSHRHMGNLSAVVGKSNRNANINSMYFMTYADVLRSESSQDKSYWNNEDVGRLSDGITYVTWDGE